MTKNFRLSVSTSWYHQCVIQVLEIKRADKYGDRSEIRSDMDQLIGRNDELRHELEKIRKELIASSVENRSVEKQVGGGLKTLSTVGMWRVQPEYSAE